MNAGYWRRTYGIRAVKEVIWVVVGYPFAAAGFAFVLAATSMSLGLAITFVGIPLLALTLWVSRWIGHVYRRVAGMLLDVEIEDPPRHRPRPGWLARLIDTLRDLDNWRAWLYLLVRFPLALLGFAVTVLVWTYGLAALSYPAWSRAVHLRDANGTVRHGVHLGSTSYLDGPGNLLAAFGIGCVLLLVAPWLVHGVTSSERWLAQSLLGPMKSSTRVQALEATRAAAVDDAAITLRRIERDLHDGTQAQLVALAMQLGMAREELAVAGSAAELDAVRARIDATHRAAKDAIGDLRDIVRGIHPPALDAGLEPALATLAARSTVPVKLTIALGSRPPAAFESIVYFSVAELLTNVARHADATTIDVTVGDRTPGILTATVTDDGHGGAHIVAADASGAGRSGLAGIAARVATVDGHLDVSSPSGGPTTVRITLPILT